MGSMALGLQPWAVGHRRPSPPVAPVSLQRPVSGRQRYRTKLCGLTTYVQAPGACSKAVWGCHSIPRLDGQLMFRRRTVRRSRAQVKVWATIPVPDSQPVLTDLGWHTDFAQHYVKVRGLACAGAGRSRCGSNCGEVIQQLCSVSAVYVHLIAICY